MRNGEVGSCSTALTLILSEAMRSKDQWRKWRRPVNTIAIPYSLARDGFLIADRAARLDNGRDPHFDASSTQSRNGKKGIGGHDERLLAERN